MKSAVSIVTALLLAPVNAVVADPLVERDAWVETFTVGDRSPRLTVGNIWGSVTVRPGPPGQITVSATSERTAPDRERFDLSLELFRLQVQADASSVSLLVGDRSYTGRLMQSCRGCRADFQFDIEVPPDTVVDVSTVMDGKVDVRGVSGSVSASNVNGPVQVGDIANCADVSSVNGRVDIHFAQVPRDNCTIETINGDITLDVPGSAGLDVALELFNGKVTSQLPIDTFSLPATVEQRVEDGRSIYRIQQLSGLRVGAGGPVYKVASMNGDLRITAHR